jgi:hypothetical protein
MAPAARERQRSGSAQNGGGAKLYRLCAVQTPAQLGVKVALVPLSLISAQANVYLLAHSAKLFAQARATAERWAAQSVRKDQGNRTLALQAQRNQKEFQQ